jgi:predicted flap endonuclease-1-like 5' DNA nuclease/predicted  nucleic acid-binding Zn-ribbon protein
MGYLATEIIGLLLGAAVLGVIVGWAIFGLGKKKVITRTVDNPALEGELKAERDLRKKAETRIVELETKETSFGERMNEREAKVSELTRQLEEITRLRGQTASEAQQRVAQLEGELQKKQEELKKLGERRPADFDERILERDRLIARYKTDLENALASTGKDAQRASQLERENAELRAALAAPVSGSGPGAKELAERDQTIARLGEELASLRRATPKDSGEKDAAIAHLNAELASLRKALEQAQTAKDSGDKEQTISRLNTELVSLRRAYEQSEQALEEQDAAIDKLTRDLQGVQHRLAIAEGRETASMTRPRVPRPVTNPRFAAMGDAEADATVSLSFDALVTPPEPRRPGNTGASPRPTPTGSSARPVASTTEASPRPPVMTENQPRPASPPTGTSRRPTGTTGVFPRAGATGTSARPTTGDPTASESTLAISLESLVAQIDAKPATAGPITRSTPRVTEGTGTTALADMVAAIDAARPSLPPAPEGASDDLMQIDGVSSTSATRLNALGLRTYKQIGSLNEVQLALVAEILKVSVDKIRREQWLEQARALST